MSDLASFLLTIGIASANVTAFMMIRKINRVVPQNERESYLSRSLRYRGKYKSLFSRDKLFWIHDCSIALMILSFIVIAQSHLKPAR